MTTFSLNIGLLLGKYPDGPDNTWTQLNDRITRARAFLNERVTLLSRLEVGSEPTLVVQADAQFLTHAQILEFVYELSEELGQDCIAVYFHDANRGYLIGPRAGDWGSFERRYFTEY